MRVFFRLRSHTSNSMCMHICTHQVTRAPPNALLEEKRVSLTCNLDGTIEEIEPTESQMFGWPASEMKGRHIADVSVGVVLLCWRLAWPVLYHACHKWYIECVPRPGILWTCMAALPNCRQTFSWYRHRDEWLPQTEPIDSRMGFSCCCPRAAGWLGQSQVSKIEGDHK